MGGIRKGGHWGADKCSQQKFDCFAYGRNGFCMALTDTNFEGECPFYKTSQKRKREHLEAMHKLQENDQFNLIMKYSEAENYRKTWNEI